jgi:hypothetical protein
MKATVITILLAVISTGATAAEPAKLTPLSPADLKHIAEYERLNDAIDRVCAIWERDLHKPEKLSSSAPLLQALIEINNKHENDLDLACGATHDEAMRQWELGHR